MAEEIALGADVFDKSFAQVGRLSCMKHLDVDKLTNLNLTPLVDLNL